MLKPQNDLFKEFLPGVRAHTAARARMERALQKLYKDYVLRIKDYLNNPDSFSDLEKYDLASATKLIEKLDPILRDAGLEDVVATYLNQFPDLTRGTLEYFRQFKQANLVGVDRQTLGTLIRFTELTLREEIKRKYLAPVQQAVMQSALGGGSIPSAVETIVGRADAITYNNVAAYATNSYAVFQRTVTAEKAEALGMDVYLYLGPEDGRTSEQCNEILNGGEHGVPNLYLRDEINSGMAEGLDGDPFTNGGHFNCRHQFGPTTRARAEAYGATFDE